MWCLKIPLPGIPPLILAALAISEKNEVPQLQEWLDTVLKGLSNAGIHVVSYACDGTTTERHVQKALMSNSTREADYVVRDPTGQGDDLLVPITMIGGRPTIMVQDAKHAGKTFRNNMNSGARFLILGNYFVLYEYARKLAEMTEHGLGPLFKRDFNRMDRQDDNAAMRLFCAEALEFYARYKPEDRRLGQIIYSFVFSELIDAYQSRHLDHFTRLKMVLRAHYFVKGWTRFLERSGHSRAQHCISREALEITDILITGFIGLLIVHRDHLKDVPFVPWDHGTETAEHGFGRIRSGPGRADFTHVDFLYWAKKAQRIIGADMEFSLLSNPSATAAGYNHTYLNTKDVNLAVLRRFPNDADFDRVALEAQEENDSMWMALEVNPRDLRFKYEGSTGLPPISSWYTPEQEERDVKMRESDVSTARSMLGDAEVSEAERMTADEAINSLIALYEGLPAGTHDDRFLELQAAAVSLVVNELDEL
jgi:hypothetical protein